MPPKRKYSFLVDPSLLSTRFDRFLVLHLSDHSRSYIQKLIESGQATVNGQTVKVSYKLRPGDIIEVEIPAPEETNLKAEAIPLDIVYEDNHLIVVNKPPGMVVHPGAGVARGTLVNALMYHCHNLSGVGGRLRPGIVHRLDKNTSGVMVIAKDDPTHLDLQKQFAERTAQRVYKALVWGRLREREGKLETMINRSKSDRRKFTVAPTGKPAITVYHQEESFSFLTLVNVRLQTGRTHQIRIHFNYLNHPVFGDPEYSGRRKQIKRLFSLSQKKIALYLLSFFERQALHAFHLSFEHPVYKKQMEFSIPLAEDFNRLLQEIKKYEEET